MKKGSWKLITFVCLIVLSFVLGACATPTPVPPTKAPEPTKAPAPAVVQPTMAPAATQPPAPTAVPPTKAPEPTKVPPTPTKPPPLMTKAGTPDTLVVAVNGQPVRLLPSQAVGRINEIINTMMFESLTTHDKDGKLVGLLAETYKAVDNTTWEFKLRKDLKFSNGDVITSADVKYTYEELIMKADKPPSPHKTFMNTIKEVKVVDPITFQIVTTQPDVMLPLRVFDITGSVVSKKHLEAVTPDKFDAQPIGTGPYKLVEWVKDSHMRFAINENFHGTKPAYKNLVLKFITDDAARMAAILAGEVDLASNVPPVRVDEIKANTKLDVRTAPGTRAHFVVLDTTKKPFSDVKVRMAVSYAIDREGLVKAVQRGYGSAVPSIFIKQSFGYDNNIKPVYDLAKAKQMMKEAGYENGFETTFDSFTGSIVDHTKTAEAVVGMLDKIGIKAKLNVAEQAVFGPKRLANQTNAIYNYSFGDAYFDMGLNMKTFVGGANGFYYSGDKEIVDLIDQALAAFDNTKRTTLYNQIMKQFYEKGILIGLYQMDQIWAADKRVDYNVQSDEMYRFFLAKPK